MNVAGAAPVLVVAREPHMCVQLEQVVRLGERAVMQVSGVTNQDQDSVLHAIGVTASFQGLVGEVGCEDVGLCDFPVSCPSAYPIRCYALGNVRGLSYFQHAEGGSPLRMAHWQGRS